MMTLAEKKQALAELPLLLDQKNRHLATLRESYPRPNGGEFIWNWVDPCTVPHAEKLHYQSWWVGWWVGWLVGWLVGG